MFLRRFSSIRSTQYPGFLHEPDAINKLRDALKNLQSALGTLPFTYYYRQTMERNTNERLGWMTGMKKEEIEERLREPVEMALERTLAEVEMVKKMKEWKPWEELESESKESETVM